MHKTVLTMGVTLSLLLCLGAGYSVSAQSPHRVIERYFHITETYVSGYTDERGVGMITVSHENSTLGTLTSVLEVSPATRYLRLQGAKMTFSDLKKGDDLSITTLRNSDGKQLPTEIIDNNTWFLENAVTKAEVTTVGATAISATETLGSKKISVPFTKNTLVLKPDGKSGTVEDIAVGRHIRARGIMRKTGTTTVIEQTYVIWILPEHGE
ncbi:MAG: hypothetical protein WC802_03330 [Patescibacteria group bacterium]|jgi:hypothetical protein